MSESIPYPKLTKLLTLAELEEMQEQFIALNESLDQIPKTFDSVYQHKIQRVLDIADEIAHHTRQLRNCIEQSQVVHQERLSKEFKELSMQSFQTMGNIANQTTQKLEERLDGLIISNAGIFILSMLLTALVMGCVTGVVFYYLAFLN